MPAYGALNSSFTVNGAVHDPLTGLDTGSGNDRFNQYVTGDGSDQLQLDTGSGNDPIVHHLGGASGPGGTSFFTENIHCTGYCFDGGTTENIGGTAGPGGMSYMTGYTNGTSHEGMDSTTEVIDVMNNFTNFAMPIGDFI